jgi:hypothetical protein
VDGCSGGCIAGLGWVNSPPPGGYGSKTAVGFAGFPSARNVASPTFTHEMGHNFGRWHAPCGNPSGVGPYPYGAGAPIGQWGYDLGTGVLYHPFTYKDYMSYCGPEWTSDFTYRALFDAWSWVSAPFGLAAGDGNANPEAILVGGYVDEAGNLIAGIPMLARAPLGRLAGEGPYRAELLDAAGEVMATQQFDVVAIAVDQAGPEGEGGQGGVIMGFWVAVQRLDGAVTLRLTGPDGASVERAVGELGPAQ